MQTPQNSSTPTLDVNGSHPEPATPAKQTSGVMEHIRQLDAQIRGFYQGRGRNESYAAYVEAPRSMDDFLSA